MRVIIDQDREARSVRLDIEVRRGDLARMAPADRRRLFSDDVQTVLDAVAECYAPRKARADVSGPLPSDVRAVCVDCGTERWLHPSNLARMNPYRCQRCALAHRRASE